MKIGKRQITLIENTIDELEGVSFPGNWQWTFQERIMYIDRYLKIVKFLSSYPENKKILEIGLCRGVFACLLNRLYSGSKVFAIEHPETRKQYTKIFHQLLKKEKIELKSCDLSSDNIPWRNNFFDFVMFSEVMEHLTPSSTLKTINEIHRVLKPNGFLFLSTPNIASLLKRINLLLGKNAIELDTRLHQGVTYGHIREYTMKEIVGLLESSRFKIEKSKYESFDSQRNVFLKIESSLSKIYPAFGNSVLVLAQKVKH